VPACSWRISSLLTRLPGLESLDIVSTESVLRSGFHERLDTWWPGLDVLAGASLLVRRRSKLRPYVTESKLRPIRYRHRPGAAPDESWWTHRDREEELVAVARQLKADERRRAMAVPARAPRLSSNIHCRICISPRKCSAQRTFPIKPRRVRWPRNRRPPPRPRVRSGRANFTRDTIVALLAFAALRVSPRRRRPSHARRRPRWDRAWSDARYLGDLDRLQALLDAGRVSAPALHGSAGGDQAARAAVGPASSLGADSPPDRFLVRACPPAADDDPFAAREPARGRPSSIR